MGRRRGCLWFGAGGMLAILAGVLAFIVMQRVATVPQRVEEVPMVPVLVAARRIPLRTVVEATDVTQRQVPPDMIPAGGLTSPEEAVGQMATADIGEGEIIVQHRLIAPDYLGPQAALVMSPTQVLVAMPAGDLLTSLGIVRPGDHVDLMLTYDFGKAVSNVAAPLATLVVLQDLEVAAVIGSQPQGAGEQATAGPPRALLLALDPQDALMVKHFRDQGAICDLALRSPTAKGLFDVVPVDGQYLLQRFGISWQAAQ